MQITQVLTANVRSRLAIAGRFFMLLDLGVASSIYVKLDMPGRNDEELVDARRGTKVRLLGDDGFKGIELLSTVTATVQFIVSQNEIDFDFFAGANVSATIAGPLPLPVSNDRGSPGNLLHVAGVTVADAPATSLNEPAAVAVNDTLDALVVANANRRAVRFTNLGPDPVAIGGAALTWAKRVIVLELGDTWNEERAANLAWSGITNAGLSASITVQEVLA